MTTYSTQNPLGSADPRDLYDNAENLDEAVNDLNSETWVDRFGVERITIQGALNRFNDVVITGGQIFESEEAGRAAVQDGQYYYTVSDDPDVSRELWQRIDANSSELIAEDPSAEGLRNSVLIANAAIDLASQPGLVSGEFYADDDEQPVYSITDEDGNALAAWNERGEMDVEPSQALSDKVQRVLGEFHTSDDDQPAFALTDKDGRPLYAVDENGQPIVPLISEFHTEDGQPAFAWTDRNGVVFYGIDEDGSNAVGGGESSGSLPATDYNLAPGARWSNRLNVSITHDYSGIYREDIYSSFPDHQSLYAFVDDLANRHPDYCGSSFDIGVNSSGDAIKAYRLKPDIYRDATASYPLDDLTLPKIVIIGLTHGNEQQAAIANLTLISDLCDRWHEVPGLEEIRWGCEVIFIPCLNPWGYDNRSRYNSDGVDLNRNFPAGWDESTTSRKGSSPASEMETQAVIGFIDSEHLASPIAGLVDHHRMFGLPSNGLSIWVGARGDETLGVCSQAIQKSIAFTRSRIIDSLEYNPGGRLTNTIEAGLTRYFQTQGVNSYLLESPSLVGNGRQEDAIRINRENIKILTSLVLKQANAKRLLEYPNPSPEHGSI